MSAAESSKEVGEEDPTSQIDVSDEDDGTSIPGASSSEAKSYATVKTGFKSPSRIPLTSSGSMTAEDALALFTSLGVPRVTAEAGERGQLESQGVSREITITKVKKGTMKSAIGGDDVMFDVEITATEAKADDLHQKSAENYGYSCKFCSYTTVYQANIKRHLLVKHGVLGGGGVKKQDISDLFKIQEAPKSPAKDVPSAAKPTAGASTKTSKSYEEMGTLISLSSSKFADTSIELIESESESVLKLPVSSLASLGEKDAVELFKTLRKATKMHVPLAAEEISVDETTNPVHSPEPVADETVEVDDDSDTEYLPQRSETGFESACELCNWTTVSKNSVSMRRHMLVAHGLVQDISVPTKRPSRKRSAGEPKKQKTPKPPKTPKTAKAAAAAATTTTPAFKGGSEDKPKRRGRPPVRFDPDD